MTEESTKEIFISEITVKKLLETGNQRYRRAQKEGYRFAKLAIPGEDKPLPAGSSVALTKDGTTLCIQRESVKCLFDTGSVTCQMNEKTLIKFCTEKYNPGCDFLSLTGTGVGFGKAS
jgi:hypothetical protein